FWLLAAIDGHAKNFSVFLRPGGGFELAPLYDVMSAQQLYDKKQIQRKDMKLAMSVGDNLHYHIHEIQPRHFQQTGMRAGLPKERVDRALEEIADTLPDATRIVCESLPADFPAELRDDVVEGVMQRRNVITT